MRESWAWLADQAGIIGALAALLALWYRVRYDLRSERKRGYEARERLEIRLTEVERKMDAHLTETGPLIGAFQNERREAAVTRQKVEGLERQVDRLIIKVDELISTIIEWRKNGSR